MMLPVVALTICSWSRHMVWELLWLNLRITSYDRSKRWYCWLSNFTTSNRILWELLVAEVLGDYHLLMILIRDLLGPIWSLRLVDVWHLALIAIIDRVECIFVLALERSDYLKSWTSDVSFSCLKIVRASRRSQGKLLFLASRGTSKVVVALLVNSWAHGLPLAILLSWHHILRAHSVVVLFMWSGSSSNKSGYAIVLSVARIVMVFLIVWWNSLILVLIVGRSTHLLTRIEVAWLMIGGRLRHKATNSSEVLLPLIIKSLATNLGIWRCPWIWHFIIAVSEMGCSILPLWVHHLVFTWSEVICLHAHV